MDLSHINSKDKSLPENKAAHLLEETKSKKSPSLDDAPVSGEKPHDGSSAKQQTDGGALDSRMNADFPPDRNGQHHPIAEFLYQLTKML